MMNYNYRGAVRLEVTYQSGRKENIKFKNKRDALPTAKRLRDLGTVADIRMKKDGTR